MGWGLGIQLKTRKQNDQTQIRGRTSSILASAPSSPLVGRCFLLKDMGLSYKVQVGGFRAWAMIGFGIKRLEGSMDLCIRYVHEYTCTFKYIV